MGRRSGRKGRPWSISAESEEHRPQRGDGSAAAGDDARAQPARTPVSPRPPPSPLGAGPQRPRYVTPHHAATTACEDSAVPALSSSEHSDEAGHSIAG